MAALPPSPPAAQPPPVPQTVDPTLGGYLQQFSLWCRHGFAAKLNAHSALPAILFQSPGGKVFSIAVGDDGRLTSTPIALGGGGAGAGLLAKTGAPGGPVLTFAQVTAAGSAALANPPGTTSGTYVMMGLGLMLETVTVTKVWVSADGQLSNSANNGETDLVLCRGTGAPPTNGAAQTGTILGDATQFVATSGGGSFGPFAITRLADGLTPGVSYWFDVALKVSAGTGTVSGLQINAQGVA